MVSVTFGPYAEQFGTGFVDDVIGPLQASDVQVNSSSTQITCTIDPGGQNIVIAMTGTNLNSGGTVTDISLSIGGENDVTISGLSLNASDVQSALSQSDPQTRTQDFASLFVGIDWQVDLTSSTVANLIFGSGGDDTISLGSGADWLMIDGGTDSLNAGGGNDIIYAKNFLNYAAGGLTSLDGGDGSDTFALDFREQDSGTADFFSKGQTVDLTKLFVMGEIIVQFANVENLRGTEFNDKLLGSSNTNLLNGEEGNDTLTGRDGADKLAGGDGNDKLIGGDGVDQLIGGGGNDTLIGGAATDYLTGGKGEDDFVYLSVADSAKQHDIIADFHHKQDDIDLTKLHPETKNDKFVFIGDHKFGHNAGELQVIEHDNSGTKNDFTMVMADLDGNGKADLQIELTGLIHMDGNDFLL